MSQIVRAKTDLKQVIRKAKKRNYSIGLVPTMGALHEGHLSLVQMSKMQYDVTVASIFINPTQFNNPQDLENYPKSEREDIQLLDNAGCDIIFIPDANEIYSREPISSLSFGYLENIMEGKHRPKHFNGVGLIVMKLFGLVEPTGAYFGQKDLQQFMIISALVNDLELPISLHMAPIIREKNGLAMSSRNKRLNDEQKEYASQLYSSLKKAEVSLKRGLSTAEVKNEIVELFSKLNKLKLEYFEIVDAETLRDISIVNHGDRLALCLAAFVAEIRLIDNIIIDL